MEVMVNYIVYDSTLVATPGTTKLREIFSSLISTEVVTSHALWQFTMLTAPT